METEDGLFVAGRHQQQRGSFRQQRGDLQEQRDEEDQYGEQEQLPLQLHLLPPSMQLQLVSLGDSFHSAMLCEAATAGLQQPDGNAEDGSETVLSLPPPPVGTSVLRARAAEGDGAEVLSMSKPMLELLVGGMGRSMAPEAFQALARHVEWLAAVDLRALTLGLAGRYRMEEHRRGTELLRAGEAAPAIFIVSSGECVMRGPVVGLKDPASAPGAGLDLALLHEGSSCGELSLVAGRPLWYSMVVSSPTARVVCIDIGSLRSWLLGSPAGNAVASDVVAAVVDLDVALYGRAVKQIAIQVLCEKLDLSLFTAPMKAIIQRVIEDNNAELNAVIHAQDRDAASRAAAKAAAANGGATAKDTLSASRPRPVVLEGWDQVEAIAAAIARPYEPQAQSWELIEQARYNAHRRQQQRYLSELHTASQLASEEHPASGHAAGDQRIAMPAPGPLAAGLAEPGAVRQPKVHDLRTTPKELRGSEVDHVRAAASSAFLPQHQLVAMMGATVHIQQAAARQLAAAAAGAAGAASADVPLKDGGSSVVEAHSSMRRLEQAAGGGLAGGTCVSSVGSVASSNVVGASSSLLARNGAKRNGRQGQGQAGVGGAPEGREATCEASFAGVAELGAGTEAGEGSSQAGDGPDGEAMGPSGDSAVATIGEVAPMAAHGQRQQAGAQGRASGWSRSSTPAGALHGRLSLATLPMQADNAVALSSRPTQRDGSPSSPGRLQPNGTASPNPLLTARKRLGAGAGTATASGGGDVPGRCPRPVVMLSQAPSCASIMLDPALRAELDRQAEIDEMLEEAAEAAAAAAAAGDGTTGAGSPGSGSALSSARGSSAGTGGGGAFAPAVGGLHIGGFQGFNAPAPQPRGRSPLGPGGGAPALAPLPWPGLHQGGEQQQQQQQSREGPANRHHSAGQGLARSLDLGPGRGLAGVGAGLGLSSSVDATMVVAGSSSGVPGGSGAAKVLPPLPAPHDPLGRSMPGAWHAGQGDTGEPGPGPTTHGSSPRANSAPAGGGTGLGGTAEAAGSKSAGGVTNRSRDSADSGVSAGTGTWRRSRMQPTAAAGGRGKGGRGAGSVAAAGEGVEEEDAPDRVFWVRDRLHDPQGLALNVMANAAAQAVAQTLAAGPAPPPLGAAPSDAEASQQAGPGISSTSPSANVLMTTGGRSAIPAVNNNGRGAARLQPLQLKRNAAAAALGASGRLGGRAGSGRPVSGGDGAGGGPVQASAGDLVAAAPQAQELGDQGMLFVTLEVPPAPKLLPEFPSPAALREAAEAEAAAREAARQARIAAALSHPSTRPLAVRPDMGYVPRYLQQRQRQPLVAPPVRQMLDDDAEGSSWVVPAYSSEIGFQEGFYDEDTQVVYFD